MNSGQKPTQKTLRTSTLAAICLVAVAGLAWLGTRLSQQPAAPGASFEIASNAVPAVPVEQVWNLIGAKELSRLGPVAEGSARLNEKSEPVLVVVVWASWCQYCKEMLDFLANAPSMRSSNGIRIVTLNVDETKSEALKAMRSHQWGRTLETYFDETGAIREWASHSKIPLTVVLNRKRDVKGIFRGGGERRATAIMGKAQREADIDRQTQAEEGA